MSINQKKLSLFPGLALSALVGAGLLTLALPGQAAATTAANAVIRNTASVSYNDEGGNPQTAVTATNDVTVNLVKALATLDAPTDRTTPTTVATDYTYTIRNNANGPGTYALSVGYAPGSGNISGHTEVFKDAAGTTTITDIYLGATTVAATANAGDTAITVPNDGAAGSEVNGIQAGDQVMIGTNTYTVLSVVDNALGTSTINLTAGLAAGGAGLGTQIGELGTFISRTTPISSVNDSTYVLTVTATDGTNPVSDATTTTVKVTATLDVKKYVRNIDVAAPCTGGTTLVMDTGLGAGSGTYCTSGVTGNPGQTLEYLIGVTNPAGGAAATNVIISDPVPAFTTKVADKIAKDPGTGTFATTGTDTVNGDYAKTAASTVYIYAGTGGSDGGTGGALAAGATTYGAFRVTIDN